MIRLQTSNRASEEIAWINTDHLRGGGQRPYLNKKIPPIIELLKKEKVVDIFIQGHKTSPQTYLDRIKEEIAMSFPAINIRSGKIEHGLLMIRCEL